MSLVVLYGGAYLLQRTSTKTTFHFITYIHVANS